MVGSDALIYRLVFNLVENGIKYNRPGGAVRVTLQQEKQTAVLRVADTGPGIPADCRESIFQPFFPGWISPAAGRWAALGLALPLCGRSPCCMAAV